MDCVGCVGRKDAEVQAVKLRFIAVWVVRKLRFIGVLIVRMQWLTDIWMLYLL